MGGRVSVTGGLSLSELPEFAEIPAEIFIAGRALYAAADPAQSAREFAAAVRGLPPLPVLAGGDE
jgi:3-dehydro-L-gulonate-6-phosphate decarboxylase